MALIILDETGLNSAPVGLFAAIYPQGASQTSTSLVSSNYVGVAGKALVTLAPTTSYTLVLTGTVLAPQSSLSYNFISAASGDTTVTIPGLRSIALSTAGHTAFMAGKLPRKWWSDAGVLPGGVTYPLLTGIAAGIAAIDAQANYLRSTERLYTCAGVDIDSWARDFLGFSLPRLINESDASYTARIVSFLTPPKCTIPAIQNVLQQYYNIVGSHPEFLGFDTAGGYDTQGGFDKPLVLGTGSTTTPNLAFDEFGSFDQRGGYDIASSNPAISGVVVYVWDKQSRPDLVPHYSIAEPQFVVAIGWDNTQPFGYVNAPTQSSTAPDANVGALVNAIKSGGTVPVYLFN